MSRIWAIASVKNEAPYILEWVSFYRAIGFDRVRIYTNDNSDLTLDLLDRLDNLDWFSWKENYIRPGESPQAKAYSEAFKLLRGLDDWVLIADIDEFLNLKQHDDIRAFLASHPGADCISVNWRVFGSGGAETKEDGFVTERFTSCAPLGHEVGNQFKSITRMDGPWRGLGLHMPHPDPKNPAAQQVNWFMFSKKQAERPGQGVDGAPSIYDMAQLNHYMVKSKSEYRSKQRRGNGFRPQNSHLLNDGYFRKYDRNEVEDSSIARHLPKMKAVHKEIVDNLELTDLLSEIERGFKAKEAQRRSWASWS